MTDAPEYGKASLGSALYDFDVLTRDRTYAKGLRDVIPALDELGLRIVSQEEFNALGKKRLDESVPFAAPEPVFELCWGDGDDERIPLPAGEYRVIADGEDVPFIDKITVVPFDV